MNDVSRGVPRQDAVRDLSAMMAAQQAAVDPAAAEQQAQAFLARVQRDIDEQVDLRVQQRLGKVKGNKGGISNQEKELMLGSMGIGIPLTLFAGYFAQLPGIIIVWLAIVLINVAWAQRR